MKILIRFFKEKKSPDKCEEIKTKISALKCGANLIILAFSIIIILLISVVSVMGSSLLLSEGNKTTSSVIISTQYSTPTPTNVVDFKSKGEATIKLKNGQTFQSPTNSIVYKEYKDLTIGFPFENSLENVKSFELINDSILIITLLDGSKLNKQLSSYSGSVLGVNNIGIFEIKTKDINRIDFQRTNYTIVKMAKVEPIGGNAFNAPADIILLRKMYIEGFGPDAIWYDGLPLSEGTILPFQEIRHMEILDGKTLGFNGWNQLINVRVTLVDGEEITSTINAKGESAAFKIFGINRFGVFQLDMVDELKSISFENGSPSTTIPTSTSTTTISTPPTIPTSTSTTTLSTPPTIPTSTSTTTISTLFELAAAILTLITAVVIGIIEIKKSQVKQNEQQKKKIKK